MAAAPLIAGPLLDASADLQGRWWIVPIDAYTPLLVGSILAVASSFLLQRLRARLADTPPPLQRDPHVA